MKKMSALFLVFAFAAPAAAQPLAPMRTASADAPKILYTCWYNDAGHFTGAQPAAANETPHYLMLTGRGGDQAWAYAIRSADGRDCPAHRPM